ncbi:MAG: hypothetical protein JWN38_495 [Candidatus Saccharibacteria bacterium]|nr:hypothetical protein [Candidatus Saccharibacteria bacterium]
MNVTALTPTGNSSKFQVITKGGDFNLAVSYTLKAKIWQLADAAAELAAAQELAEALVSRHDPALPFKPLYIFAEHNTDSSLATTVQLIRKNGFSGDR